jgi:hypothetical protein
MSPPWDRGCGVHEVAGEVCDNIVVWSSALGRYKGLRIGHEIPACSRTSVHSQIQGAIDLVTATCTFRSMLKRETDYVIRDTKVHLARTSCLADQLLRQQYPYSTVGVASVP